MSRHLQLFMNLVHSHQSVKWCSLKSAVDIVAIAAQEFLSDTAIRNEFSDDF
jgi:hypothetical protein